MREKSLKWSLVAVFCVAFILMQYLIPQPKPPKYPYQTKIDSLTTALSAEKISKSELNSKLDSLGTTLRIKDAKIVSLTKYKAWVKKDTVPQIVEIDVTKDIDTVLKTTHYSGLFETVNDISVKDGTLTDNVKINQLRALEFSTVVEYDEHGITTYFISNDFDSVKVSAYAQYPEIKSTFWRDFGLGSASALGIVGIIYYIVK